MIKIQGHIPRDSWVAVSGGMDSIAVANFLAKRHNIKLIYINHFDEHADDEMAAVELFAKDRQLEFCVKNISRQDVPKGMSRESFWHGERYAIFHEINAPVLTGHHLDDCVESWVWSSMHGNGYIIPYMNRNVIRPFRLNKKVDMRASLAKSNTVWFEDPTNVDCNFAARNYVRHEMMPHVLKINPGIHKVVRRKVEEDFRDGNAFE